jgi:predicted RNA-binding Zn-ribbon protein involved in translation (DUF1610 family)
MAIKTYLLYCEICNYKKITTSNNEPLIEVKTSPIMIQLPKIDPETKKSTVATFKQQKKRFKCPNCGRVIFPKKIEAVEKDKDEEDNNSGHQTSNERSKIQRESSS